MTARYDKLGAVTVPPTASVATGATLATTCDPMATALLSSFKSVINTKLNTVWAAAAHSISASGNAVVGTYPYEPIPEFANRGWTWPALFMWREKERLHERTQVYDTAESTGKLAYILPPMPYEQAVKLEPIRVAVRTVLVGFVEGHGDPAVNSGASPVTANSLDYFRFTEAEYGFLESADRSLLHPTVTFTWEAGERQSFVDANYSTLSAIYTTIAVASEASYYTTAASTVLISAIYDPT